MVRGIKCTGVRFGKSRCRPDREAVMMSVGLHMRLTCHPGRAKTLIRFIQYILGHPRVWVCRREDIARHWIARFPAPT